MAKELIFIPIARSELGAIDGSLSLTQRSAHRVTSELLAALEYSPEQQEDAEYAALVLASVAALAAFGERLVLVAEVDSTFITPGDDLPNGACIVAKVRPQNMTCWFSEAPGVDSSGAAAAAHGLDIDTAWGFDEVQDLLRESDLLWNDVEEYRRGL
ncbi:MAG: hypothetical protein Q4D79_05965 [Propionibacteriaceae bacterium]|nr:hypothetical protein [Propionibacteriaceae bacterium]